MPNHRTLALVSVALLIAACGSGTPPSPVGSSGSTGTSGGATSLASTAPRTSARVTSAPLVAVNGATLKGTGSKVGPTVVLFGDYVFKDAVKTRPGCHFAAYLDGLDADPIDEVSTDAQGNNSTSIDEIGLDLERYSLRVVATKCGAWTVSLTRP